MLGAPCSPCCNTGAWYCYDYQYCGCIDIPNRLQPDSRWLYIIPTWTVTQTSYGLFQIEWPELVAYTPPEPGVSPGSSTYINRQYAYKTTYTQDSFAFTAAGHGYQFSQYETPSGQRIIYAPYNSSGNSRCASESQCQYPYTAGRLGPRQNYGANDYFSEIGPYLAIGYPARMNWLQELYVNIACTKGGFVPSAFGQFACQYVSADRISELSYSATSLVRSPTEWVSGNPANVATLGADVVRGDFWSPTNNTYTLLERLRFPPQPDFTEPTVQRLLVGPSGNQSVDATRCYGARFILTYPLRKWSLTGVSPIAAELLTVGTLSLQIGDVASEGQL